MEEKSLALTNARKARINTNEFSRLAIRDIERYLINDLLPLQRQLLLANHHILEFFRSAQRSILQFNASIKKVFDLDFVKRVLHHCLSIMKERMVRTLQRRFPDFYHIIQEFQQLRSQGNLSNAKSMAKFFLAASWKYFDTAILTQENMMRVAKGFGYVKVAVSIGITIAIAVEFPPAIIFLVPTILNVVGLPIARRLAKKFDMPAIEKITEMIAEGSNWLINPIGSLTSKAMGKLTEYLGDAIINYFQITGSRKQLFVRLVTHEVGDILATAITMGIAQCAAPRVQSINMSRPLPGSQPLGLPPTGAAPLPLPSMPSNPPIMTGALPALPPTTGVRSFGSFSLPEPMSLPSSSASSTYRASGNTRINVSKMPGGSKDSFMVNRFSESVKGNSKVDFSQLPGGGKDSFMVNRFSENVGNISSSTYTFSTRTSGSIENTYSTEISFDEVRLSTQDKLLIIKITSKVCESGIRITREVICLYLDYKKSLYEQKQLLLKAKAIREKQRHCKKVRNLREQYKHELEESKEQLELKELEIREQELQNIIVKNQREINSHLLDVINSYRQIVAQDYEYKEFQKIIYAELQVISILDEKYPGDEEELFSIFDNILEKYTPSHAQRLREILREEWKDLLTKEKLIQQQKEKIKMSQEKFNYSDSDSGSDVESSDSNDNRMIVPRGGSYGEIMNVSRNRGRHRTNGSGNDRFGTIGAMVQGGEAALGEIAQAAGTITRSVADVKIARTKLDIVKVEVEGKKDDLKYKRVELKEEHETKRKEYETKLGIKQAELESKKVEGTTDLEKYKTEIGDKKSQREHDLEVMKLEKDVAGLKTENEKIKRKYEKLKEQLKTQVENSQKELRQKDKEYKEKYRKKYEKKCQVGNHPNSTFGQRAQADQGAFSSPSASSGSQNQFQGPK